MSSIAEGITEAGAEENVNSESGFEAALARKTGATLPEGRQATDTSVADGLETVEPGTQPRDGVGRFTAQADTPDADEPDTSEEETPEDEGDPLHDDPAVAAFLARHNGDTDAALRAAVEAQSLIGRQGNELGTLREQQARLEGQLQALMAQGQQPQMAPVQLTAEDIENMVEEHGGLETARWAAANGDRSLVDAVVRVWKDVDADPFDALAFRQDYLLYEQEQRRAAEAAAQQPPAASPTDAWVQSQVQTQAITSTLDAFSTEAKDWEAIAPHMLTALEQVPKRIAALVTSDDPEERLDGVRVVADKARALAAVERSASPAASSGRADAVRAAQVVTGSLRPSPQRQSGEPKSSAEIHAEFKKALLETETTSVSEGLTYGK